MRMCMLQMHFFLKFFIRRFYRTINNDESPDLSSFFFRGSGGRSLIFSQSRRRRRERFDTQTENLSRFGAKIQTRAVKKWVDSFAHQR